MFALIRLKRRYVFLLPITFYIKRIILPYFFTYAFNGILFHFIWRFLIFSSWTSTYFGRWWCISEKFLEFPFLVFSFELWKLSHAVHPKLIYFKVFSCFGFFGGQSRYCIILGIVSATKKVSPSLF